MSGVQLLDEIRRRDSRVARLLMSGSIDHNGMLAAQMSGIAHRFLDKPWPPGELQRVLLAVAQELDA